MKMHNLSRFIMLAGLLVAAPALAQTTPTQKQKTDGNSPTTVGPGSAAYKQRTDGNSPTMVGPGSGAYKQHTQALIHSGQSPTSLEKKPTD